MHIQVKQHDITDCGAACIASLCAHYRLELPIARIRQQAGTDQRGTNLLGMIAALERLGFEAKGVKARKEALRSIPLPAIAHIITEKKLHHYIVLYAIGKNWVKVMDPGSGKLEKWPETKFLDQWTEILILAAPGETFEPGNRKHSVGQRLWALLQPHRSLLLQALIGACIYTMLGLAMPVYIQKITDQVLATGNLNLLNLLSLGMIGILLFQILMGWLKSIFVLKTGQLIDATLIMGYYRRLLQLPQTFFDTMRTGEILSRIGDVVKIRTFINETAIGILVSGFIILFSALLMFTYYWKLAVMAFLSLPFYLAIYWISNTLNKKWERKLMEEAAAMETQLVESLNNVRTIRQFGLEGYSAVKTEQKFSTLLQTILQSGKNQLAVGNAAELVSRLLTITLLWAGSYFVLSRLITAGELLSFYALIGYFNGPVGSLIGMNKTLQNAWIAADRLFEILDLETEQTSGQEFDLRPEKTGDIIFEDVHFKYGSRKPVFRGLSFHIPKGSTLGIVGESGCGKSTTAALLQRLYPVDSGNIRIGAVNLQHISTASLRNLIAVVPQQTDIFAGSILENIALGEPWPDLERVVDICADLGLLPFIESLPDGFGALLGEHGANLSGGQKQRIGIARALYRDPEILILDEATAALDYTSETFVDQVIERLKQAGKTVIIIAHRLRTVMHADKIIVVREGQVAEEGTHPELLRLHGAYHELWRRQFPDRTDLATLFEYNAYTAQILPGKQAV